MSDAVVFIVGMRDTPQEKALYAQVEVPYPLLYRIHDALYFAQGQRRGLESLDGMITAVCTDPLERAVDTLGYNKEPRKAKDPTFRSAGEVLQNILNFCREYPYAEISVNMPHPMEK